MEFNSQICTSVEQSKRLLELGLKKETADMCWQKITINGELITYPTQYVWHCNMAITDHHLPAWSLHRLIEILGPNRLPIHFRKKGRVDITISYINQACSGRSGYNYYDSIIDCIEWLINEGYNHFNKDYLEEKK